LLGAQLSEPHDHRVAEGTRGEGRVRLDQGDREAPIGLAQRARAAGAGKTAPDDDDARRGALCPGASREEGGARGGADAELEEFATTGFHF
jgi:hypothetical protein